MLDRYKEEVPNASQSNRSCNNKIQASSQSQSILTPLNENQHNKPNKVNRMDVPILHADNNESEESLVKFSVY